MIGAAARIIVATRSRLLRRPQSRHIVRLKHANLFERPRVLRGHRFSFLRAAREPTGRMPIPSVNGFHCAETTIADRTGPR